MNFRFEAADAGEETIEPPAAPRAPLPPGLAGPPSDGFDENGNSHVLMMMGQHCHCPPSDGLAALRAARLTWS